MITDMSSKSSLNLALAATSGLPRGGVRSYRSQLSLPVIVLRMLRYIVPVWVEQKQLHERKLGICVKIHLDSLCGIATF